MTIQIDNDIPVPSHSKYPFAEMKVGDSFLVSGIKRGSLSASIVHATRKLGNGHRFITRTVEGGIRIWRVA